MKYDRDKFKSTLKNAKEIMRGRGFIIMLYGIIFSILANVVSGFLTDPIEELLYPAIKWISYDYRSIVYMIPTELIAVSISAVASIGVLLTLINMVKYGSHQGVKEYLDNTLFVTKKYWREGLTIVVIPMALVGVLTKIITLLVLEEIVWEIMFASSIKLVMLTLVSYFLSVLISTASLGVHMYSFIKFSEAIDEISFSYENVNFLKKTAVRVSIIYGLVSLIPVIGALIALIIYIPFGWCYNAFIISCSELKYNPQVMMNYGNDNMGGNGYQYQSNSSWQNSSNGIYNNGNVQHMNRGYDMQQNQYQNNNMNYSYNQMNTVPQQNMYNYGSSEMGSQQSVTGYNNLQHQYNNQSLSQKGNCEVGVKRCIACGQRVAPSSVFCPSCGQKL